MRPVLALVGVCTLLGCSTRSAVQLVLTADPTITPMEDLLAQVAGIRVVVDAEGGLHGVETSGERADGSTAQDWDDDGELEVLFDTAVDGQELPILEIGLQDNSDRELAFTVLGFPQLGMEETVALGGVSAVCPEGEVHRVGTPFNLLAWARSPQVVLALPADGDAAEQLRAATVLFSTTVKEDTLVVQVLDPNAQVVSTELTLDTAYATQDEQRSLLTISFLDDLVAGWHDLQVGPGIVSNTGLDFDQDPSTEEAEAFASTFENVPGSWNYEPCEECPDGYACDDEEGGCVPVQDCSAGCGAGFVCDDEQEICVEDCRIYGVCLEPGATCDWDSGLCST